MQDIGPDMEDLLRKAADLYPLKKGEDKWNEIALKISQQTTQPKQKQRKKYYRLLLLCGLLLAFLVLNDYTKQVNSSGKQNHVPQSAIQSINNDGLLKADQEGPKTVGHPFSEEKNKHTNGKEFFDVQNDEREKLITLKNSIINSFSSQPFEEEILYKEASTQLKKNSRSVVLEVDTVKKYTEAVNIDKKKRFASKGFYYGMNGGFNMNAVKDQGYKKRGFETGVVAGYRFGSPFSLETGVSFVKKYYWTGGKYFDAEEMKSTMPAGMEITELHGSTGIIVIPFHLRYDIINKRNHRFYSSTGFSSYIITNENNEYFTMLNGTSGKMNGNYPANRNYFAASIDVGLGYEKDIGRKNHLRHEPYLQLPIRGIGVGRLQVRTAGVRIAITRSAQ
jgi:hypothetical protein